MEFQGVVRTCPVTTGYTAADDQDPGFQSIPTLIMNNSENSLWDYGKIMSIFSLEKMKSRWYLFRHLSCPLKTERGLFRVAYRLHLVITIFSH